MESCITIPQEQSLKQIWYESVGFNYFRGDTWMPEPCQSCDEKEKDYGGCRCQAFMLTGKAENTDPVCAKSPHHDVILQAQRQANNEISIDQLVARNSRNSKKIISVVRVE